MILEHVEIRQRELPLSGALDADATDERAVLVPPHENRRQLPSLGLHAPDESPHVGIVGAATEIDESHPFSSCRNQGLILAQHGPVRDGWPPRYSGER